MQHIASLRLHLAKLLGPKLPEPEAAAAAAAALREADKSPVDSKGAMKENEMCS